MNEDNMKENLKLYLTDMGFEIVKTNNEFIRFLDKNVSVYMNIFWEDVANLCDILDIDMGRDYTYLIANCCLDGIFYHLSENIINQSTNQKIKVWAQRLNGSNDLWLYGYLKDNVGEFSIELDIEDINKMSLTPEEFNDSSTFHKLVEEHYKNKYDLYTRLYIDDVEIEIIDASQIYRLIFLRDTSLKMTSQFDGSYTLKLKRVTSSNLHSFIQQAIFIFSLLNNYKLTFGFKSSNNYKLIGYENINS